ncbi:MAG: BCD family MFS transporter [Chloroflexota bacterium]
MKSLLRIRIQLGLVHLAVAMTLVPINSTLNRVMIKELALSATLVAALASLPYFFSPLQVWIGGYSDRHPIFGWRRTAYIALGLLLCVAGVVISPQVAFLIAENRVLGILAALVAFGAWGMGYNFASVSYLALASELSGEKDRGRTVAVMWVMMIISIIATAILISRMVDPYTPAALQRAFWAVGLAALVLGLIGLVKLEPRRPRPQEPEAERVSWKQMAHVLLNNPQARLFFIYLLLLLAALLGQDVLLEPFAAEAFGLTVAETTRITSIWGGATLLAMVTAGVMEGRLSKRIVAQTGNIVALAAFALITLSGFLANPAVFYTGVVLLGVGTGLSTVANLSLMLDMTTAQSVGLYIGAWGMANAFSRLTGSLLGGAVRDLATRLLGDAVLGYTLVFSIETLMLAIAILLFTRIDVSAFQRQAEERSPIERAAMAAD